MHVPHPHHQDVKFSNIYVNPLHDVDLAIYRPKGSPCEINPRRRYLYVHASVNIGRQVHGTRGDCRNEFYYTTQSAER